MDNDHVANFVQSATEFCSFVESPPAAAADAFQRAAERALIRLYLHGIDLPHVEPSDVDAPEVRAPGPSSWPGFGDRDIYWMLFETNEPAEPVRGSLSDDFLDIYNDVKTGLLLWSVDARAEAVWHWRFNFDTHWGRHAVEAMRALRLASST